MAAEASIIDDAVTAAVTYRTPDDFMVGTVLLGAFFALLIAGVAAKIAYNNHLKATGQTRQECPFDSKFLVAVIVTGVFGGFLAYFGSGIVLGMMGQQDAPAMVYYGLAFLIGIAAGAYGGPFLRSIVDGIRDKLKIGGNQSGDSGAQTDGTQTKRSTVTKKEE